MQQHGRSVNLRNLTKQWRISINFEDSLYLHRTRQGKSLVKQYLHIDKIHRENVYSSDKNHTPLNTSNRLKSEKLSSLADSWKEKILNFLRHISSYPNYHFNFKHNYQTHEHRFHSNKQ